MRLQEPSVPFCGILNELNYLKNKPADHFTLLNYSENKPEKKSHIKLSKINAIMRVAFKLLNKARPKGRAHTVTDFDGCLCCSSFPSCTHQMCFTLLQQLLEACSKQFLSMPQFSLLQHLSKLSDTSNSAAMVIKDY